MEKIDTNVLKRFIYSIQMLFILISFFHRSITKKFKIEDAYGKDIREFERCFCDIKLCLKNLLRII